MSDNILLQEEDKILRASIAKKMSAGRSPLLEKMEKKEKQHKSAVAGIFKTLHENNPSVDIGLPSLKEDTNFTPGLKMKSLYGSRSVENSEFEPKNLIWKPVKKSELEYTLYNKDKAISDIDSAIRAAIQQPGVSVALVGPGDARGGFFLKADKTGTLMLASSDPNIHLFSNPGMNADGDADEDDKGKPSVPNTKINSLFAVLESRIQALEKEVKELRENKKEKIINTLTEITEDDPLSIKSLTESRINIESILPTLDDKSRDVIQRLLGAAKDLREGNPRRSLLRDPLPSDKIIPKTNNVLLDNFNEEGLTELLCEVQNQLKNDKNPKLELFANDISEALVENLLTEHISSETKAILIQSYNKLME